MNRELIVLRGVVVEAIVGVFEHERHAKRPLTVDLELSCDLAAAARSDRIEDTADYFALVRRVRELCSNSSHRLIEKLAAEIAEICLAEPRVRSALVTVHKPGAIEEVADIAVVIERSRSVG